MTLTLILKSLLNLMIDETENQKWQIYFTVELRSCAAPASSLTLRATRYLAPQAAH
jgi:hypothetical protein